MARAAESRAGAEAVGTVSGNRRSITLSVHTVFATRATCDNSTDGGVGNVGAGIEYPTRIGKPAVELWLRPYLAKPQWLPRQVAACLWNAESAACDRTLSWPLGDTIRARAYTVDLSYRGLPVACHAELAAWIDRERPALTAARQAAFDSAVRQSGKIVEADFQTTLPLQVPPGKKDHA